MNECYRKWFLERILLETEVIDASEWILVGTERNNEKTIHGNVESMNTEWMKNNDVKKWKKIERINDLDINAWVNES